MEAGVDAIVIDTAHGHSKGVAEMLKLIKQTFPQIDAGQYRHGRGGPLLGRCRPMREGGHRPGSICTTRVIAGVEFPRSLPSTGGKGARGDRTAYADGLRYSGDIVKALAVGGTSVMMGSLLAALRSRR